MSAQQERIVANAVVPLDFTYNYRVGQYVERYIKGLGQKKIMGVKCPGDSSVIVPPRKYCGRCNEIMNEWVEVGPEGTVENFTVGHVNLNKGAVEKADTEYVVALIKLDGATSLLAGQGPGRQPGRRRGRHAGQGSLQNPAEDSLEDLSHFEPAG